VPDGTPGVLHVRTPSTSAGYWNHPDHTRRAFADGWFKTGDLLTRDADGFYHHQGRADDVFKVAGQWVAPADVERVLLTHPAVAEAVVVGAAEAGGLVKPFAFVVAKAGECAEGLTDELVALAGTGLRPHQRPRRIAVVDELPRTATGKIQRYLLKQRIERA
jgi:benzoate-CoA ligase